MIDRIELTTAWILNEVLNQSENVFLVYKN